MSLTLADSSAWVEYLRGTGSDTDLQLRRLLDLQEVAVTDPVLMEVVAGARSDEQVEDHRRMLFGQSWLGVDIAADYEGSAALYRHCRGYGVTPRGLLDCLIAAVAIRNGVPILAHDRDFDSIAEVSDLRLTSAGD